MRLEFCLKIKVPPLCVLNESSLPKPPLKPSRPRSIPSSTLKQAASACRSPTRKPEVNHKPRLPADCPQTDRPVLFAWLLGMPEESRKDFLVDP